MTIRELIALIKKRPLNFVRHHSLTELEVFINGYSFHRGVMGETENLDEEYNRFIDSWIYYKLDVADKQGWKEAIAGSCNSEAEAFWRFFDLWNEYLAEQDGTK
jgi:hypothetical protein